MKNLLDKKILKKVLVVSDNFELASFFQEEYYRQSLDNVVEVEYSYSHDNNFLSKMMDLGAKPINVKNPDFIAIAKSRYSLIISIHCKQIFPDQLVEAVKCVNLHPGFNPHNRGWFPHVFSIINKLPAGATLHMIDTAIDHGKIIAQKEVETRESDTSMDLYNRIIDAEKLLIRENIFMLLTQEYTDFEFPKEGNYNSKSDFERLCSLDMESVGTLRDHIDLLRALSHGDYKNAYFFDISGRKIYVSLNLRYDN